MSRSGYSDDLDTLTLGQWRGRVASAIRGKRGQSFLVALREALDAMPVKRLVSGELEQDGEVCAIGSVGRARGLDMGRIDPEDPAQVSGAFNIAEPMAQEIVWINDENGPNDETPEARYERVRRWVERQIK